MTTTFIDNPANEAKVELISMISDMHKDAYGFRNRNTNFQVWSMDELNAYVDELQEIIKADIEAEKIYEAEAEAAFKKLVEKTINLGANDEKTALKWLFEAYLVDGELDYFEMEKFLYENGIMHTVYGKGIKAQIIGIYGN